MGGPRGATRFTTVLLGAVVLAAGLAPVVHAGAISSVEIVVPSPAPEAHHAVNIAARPSSDVHEAGGTLTFSIDDVVIPGCTALDPGAWGNYAFCAIGASDLAPGTYTVHVDYSGTGSIDPSSGETELTIVADAVHAVEVGLSLTTFYPIPDGYRDKVRVQGFRQEALSGTIRIYNPSGTLIKTVAVASGTGAYFYDWDGRTSSGNVRDAGTYKVVQTLGDGFSTKAFTSFVYLSHKRLIWHTKVIERTGDSANDAGGHVGSTSEPAGSPAIKLMPGTGDAQAGWLFTVPGATVYKSMTFKAYAKHTRTTGDTTRLGLQDFTKLYPCVPDIAALWPVGCFGGFHAVGNTSGTTAWFATAGLGNNYRWGHTVRGIVFATKKVTYVYRVQLVVKYATLGF
jgi:hypothetical protein